MLTTHTTPLKPEDEKSKEQIATEVQAVLARKVDIIKNLLPLFVKGITEKNSYACAFVKNELQNYITNSIENMTLKSLELKALFSPPSTHQESLQLVKHFIQLTESLLIQNKAILKGKQYWFVSNLLNDIYRLKLLKDTPGFTMTESQRVVALNMQIDDYEKLPHIENIKIKTYLKRIIDEETDTETRQRAELLLDKIKLRNDTLPNSRLPNLAKHNHLPAVYILARNFFKPRAFLKPHVRRPLYLCAKILLLITDISATAEKHNLSIAQVNEIKTFAQDFLNIWVNKIFRDPNESGERYQHHQLALWYRDLIAKAALAKQPIDPEAFMVQELEQEVSSDMRNLIYHFVVEDITRVLNVEQSWIQQKLELPKTAKPKTIDIDFLTGGPGLAQTAIVPATADTLDTWITLNSAPEQKPLPAPTKPTTAETKAVTGLGLFDKPLVEPVMKKAEVKSTAESNNKILSSSNLSASIALG